MSLVGIDISQRMIEYVRAQAEAHQVNERVEFHVMDALRTLELPAASFDLVNLRFGVSFVRTWDWPKLLSELLRVTRPGGVIRLTDTNDAVPLSNSSALIQLFEMFQCACYRSGHLFEQKRTGIIDHLAQLLDQYGCERVRTKIYALDYQGGTVEGKSYCENCMLLFQTARPFIQKRGCESSDYDAIYRQALEEMRRPNFQATWNLFTAWGSKP